MTTGEQALGAVLVVDDDGVVRRSITRILERAGHRCREASSAAEAIDLATREDFVLVTCDVQMPGESGLDLIPALRAQQPDIAVVMVSGMADPQTAAAATDLGAYGYVVKPFESNQMLIVANNALRRRELEIENRSHRQHLELLVVERTADLMATVERLSRTETALRASREEAIRRLAQAVEFRDPTTGAHLERMSRTCELLAERSGMGSERAQMIRIASPMHDIGKIAVPDHVLHKPGKLDDEDWEEMRRHPLIGHQILSDSESELLRLGGLIALTHHERFDGTGYPHGLRGEDIPTEGRIVAVADVFDALTSERPYKPAFEVDHALQIMRDERGQHFDPDYLDLFFSLIDEVVGVANTT